MTRRECRLGKEIYFSGVNSDSSATLVVGVFRSSRVGVRDLLFDAL